MSWGAGRAVVTRCGRLDESSGDDTDDEDEGQWKDLDDHGLVRPCTWRPGKPCWLRDNLHWWNSMFHRAGLELKEHVWSQMMIEQIRDVGLSDNDILRGALLMHILLRHHSCVTRVDYCVKDAEVEYKLFWDALKSAASSLTHLHYQATELPAEHRRLEATTIPLLNSLRYLHLHDLMMDRKTSEACVNFIVESSALETLWLTSVQGSDAGLPARGPSSGGRSSGLAHGKQPRTSGAVMDGGSIYPPSGVLRAALFSKSLKVLRVHKCRVTSEEIQKMSAALNRSPPPAPAHQLAYFDTPMLGVNYHIEETMPTSHLETLEFVRCNGFKCDVKEPFASFIGGVLLSLTLKECSLDDKFAVAAAKRLHSDVRLRLLDVTENEITIRGLTRMINALGAHRKPETFAFSPRSLLSAPTREDGASFLEALRNYGASSRLHVFWMDQFPTYFLEGLNLCTLSRVSIWLQDGCGSFIVLDAVATSCTISTARFVSRDTLGEDVTGKLVEVIHCNRYIRSLDLSVCVAADEGLSLLKALKDTTVEELVLTRFTFDERLINALHAMVSANRCINKLTIKINYTDIEEKEAHQLYRALVEALKENYVLASLVVRAGKYNSANEFDIRKLMRRNMMQVHEAVRFVMGFNERRHALAFDVQKDSRVLRETVSSIYNLTEEEASTRIAEARYRLATFTTLASCLG